MDDSFTVNGFMFCTDHGSELCNICGADYRMGNNYRISDDHTKIKSAVGRNFNMEKRTSLRAYSLGAVFSGNAGQDGYRGYQCQTHSTLDCERCFDWPSLIISQAGDKDFEGRVHSRADLLGLLKSMGIDMPPETKMSDDALNKKLGNALTCSQKISQTFEKLPIDLFKFPPWTAAESKTALQAMGKFSTSEAVQQSMTPNRSIPLYEDAFMDARQTLLHIIRNFGMGKAALILQDEDSTEAICIRVLNIYKVNSETPIIALIYSIADLGTSPQDNLDFVGNIIRTGLLAQIQCTNREQALLRKLLTQNSQRVSSNFKPKLQSAERHFKSSFLIPLYPLEQTDIGRLSHNTGCHRCGDDSKSRCSACQSVSYCGPACQKIDWKEHKVFCKTIKGGNWLSMNFKNQPTVNGKKGYNSIFNRSESLSMLSASKKMAQATKDHDDDSPPADVHGNQPFLVKVQKLVVQADPGMQTPVALLVYDRQRSFMAYVMRDDDPTAYQEAMKQIIARNNRNKVYRWAKRTGPFELSVCLDRIPEPEPTW